MHPMSFKSLLQELKSASEKRPYLFIAVLLIVLVLTLLLVPWILTPLNISDYAPALLGEILACAVALLLLNWLGWWERLGYATRMHRHDFLLLSVPLLFVVLPALAGFLLLILRNELHVPSGDLVYFALQALLIGFLEETYFRGFILQTLLPRGLVLAVLLSALLFTLAHSVSLFNGANIFYVCAQLLLTIGWGASFAALWVRTQAIWPLIVFHILRDFCSLTIQENQGGQLAFSNQTSIWAILSSLLLSILLIVYTFWMLRPVRLEQMNRQYAVIQRVHASLEKGENVRS